MCICICILVVVSFLDIFSHIHGVLPKRGYLHPKPIVELNYSSMQCFAQSNNAGIEFNASMIIISCYRNE